MQNDYGETPTTTAQMTNLLYFFCLSFSSLEKYPEREKFCKIVRFTKRLVFYFFFKFNTLTMPHYVATVYPQTMRSTEALYWGQRSIEEVGLELVALQLQLSEIFIFL